MNLLNFIAGYCIVPGERNRRRKKETKDRKWVKKWPKRSSIRGIKVGKKSR